MNNNENKKKSEIVYKTVEETIVVTEEDVDVKWIRRQLCQKRKISLLQTRYC